MQNDRLIQLTYSEDEDIVDRQDFTVKRPNVRQSPSRRSVRVCVCVYVRTCVCLFTREAVYIRTYVPVYVRMYTCVMSVSSFITVSITSE